MSIRKRLIGKTFKNDYSFYIIEACRNAGNLETFGKCADIKLGRQNSPFGGERYGFCGNFLVKTLRVEHHESPKVYEETTSMEQGHCAIRSFPFS